MLLECTQFGVKLIDCRQKLLTVKRDFENSFIYNMTGVVNLGFNSVHYIMIADRSKNRNLLLA